MNRLLLSFAAAILASGVAHAGAAVCTVSVSGVSFSSFNPLPGQSAVTNGTITVTCTGNPLDSASYTITIAPGLGSYAGRDMAAGAHGLAYNLYRDSGYTQVWGDGMTAGTFSVSDSVTLSSSSCTKNYIVYARIAGGQKVAPAGAYHDSLLVTISY
jgi:spore coat protein U-like protein